jgi:hypothetical protein
LVGVFSGIVVAVAVSVGTGTGVAVWVVGVGSGVGLPGSGRTVVAVGVTTRISICPTGTQAVRSRIAARMGRALRIIRFLLW